MRYFHYAVNSCVNFFPGLRLHSKQFCILSVRSGVSAGGVVRGGTRGVGKTNTQYAATALERGCHTHRLPGHPPSLAGQHLCYGNRTGLYLQLTGVRVRSQSYGTEKRTDFSPTAWVPPQEVLELCRIGCLQALTDSRSFCFPLLTEQKHHSSQNYGTIERHSLGQETVVIRSEGREIAYTVRRDMKGNKLVY